MDTAMLLGHAQQAKRLLDQPNATPAVAVPIIMTAQLASDWAILHPGTTLVLVQTATPGEPTR
jgi:membrane-bound lytic murein transglycosylase